MNRVSAPGVPSIKRLSVIIQTRLITASMFTRSLAPITSTNSLNEDLQVHTIMASKCISIFAPSRCGSAFLSSLDHCLPKYLQLHSITTSEYARSCPPSTYLISHNYVLQTCTIMAYKFATSWPSDVSLNTLDYGLQVRKITACMYIAELARPRPRSVSLSSLDIFCSTSNHYQAPPAVSPDTPCLDELPYRYMDENRNWIH